MSELTNQSGGDINSQTTAIVSAYLSNNSMDAAAVPALIRSVQDALAGGAVADAQAEAEADEPLKPAVSIRKSVTPKAVTCLECGKSFKSLKRHLGTSHDLTAKEYKERWDLPRDYPLVAPEYSARRAETAKKIGLGRKKKK